MSQGGLDIQSMLFRAVHFSDRLDTVVEDSIDTILGTSITLIRIFEKQKNVKSITRIMKDVPQALQTLPGIDLCLLLVLLLKSAKFEPFDDKTKITKYVRSQLVESQIWSLYGRWYIFIA